MSNRGQAQYRQLTEALRDTTPPCSDDWRYILDQNELDELDQRELRATCNGCPVFDLCAAYGRAGRPTGGMWAGKYYQEKQK